jgi:hypothetical protein
MLEDGTYDALIIDVDVDNGTLRVDVTIVSGAHKGDVVSLRATDVRRDPIELLGIPVTLFVEDGAPRMTFD